MLHNQLIISALLLFALGLTGVLAQENINASGGNATGSGGSVSYSVGQVVYYNHSGPNGSVLEGLQQPYEITVVTGIEAARDIILSFSAYPNPTSDYLTLEVTNFDRSTLYYQLYDIQGILLQTGEISGPKTTVAFSHMISATYFLKVMENNNEVKTFKILKK